MAEASSSSRTDAIIDEKLVLHTPKDDLTENQRIPSASSGGQTRKWRKTRRKLLVKTPLQQKMCGGLVLTPLIICSLIFIPQPQNAMPIHTHQHNQESTQSLTSAMVRMILLLLKMF